MTSYQPPGAPPQTGYPQPQQPQQGQTPPYWPDNQTPPQYQQAPMLLPAAPQQMPAGYPAPQQQPPPGYGQPQQPAPPPAVMPQIHQVDDAAMAAHYQRTKEEMQRGGGAGFLKIPGPRGQEKWDSSVPIGYEGSVPVHICGPWAAGKPIFVPKRSYFWKSRSKPNGTSIMAPPQGDLIQQALELGANSPDPSVQKFVKDFGRPRMNYLYNVLQLDNPQLHVGQDGVMRPLVLDGGKQIHTAIGDVFTNAEGASNIVDYSSGRPVRIIRKKTGNRNVDIEWTAMPSMNQAPVPQQFWPALQNMWDLEAFIKYPTVEEMQAAVLDMGLPMPGQPMQMQVPQGYNPGTAAPYPNPYPQPQMVPPMAPQVAPQMALPMQPQMGAAPPPPPMGPPPAMGPPPGMAPQMAPPMAPPPVQSAQVPPQQPTMPPQQTQMAPAMNPPPISSAAPQMPPQGAPPPVPGQAPAPPAQPGMQVAPPVGQTNNQVLSLPLQPGMTLDGGRERCFGQHNATDNFCIQCPDWIKGQCVTLSPTQQEAQPADGGLAALQQQLQG